MCLTYLNPLLFGLQVDLKIRIRLMKIIMGVSKVSICLCDPYLKLKMRAIYPLVLTPLMLAPCTNPPYSDCPCYGPRHGPEGQRILALLSAA